MKNKDYRLVKDITDNISDELLEPKVRNELCRLSEKYGVDIYCSEFTGRGYPLWLNAMTPDFEIAESMSAEYREFLKLQDTDVLVETVSDVHEEFAIFILHKCLKFKYEKDSVMFSNGRIWIPEEV